MQRPFASTGVAPLPRYYGLIRLLLSLTLLAVLPSSLAGLSKHAAPFAPPRPRSPNRIGHEVLTSHIETCWSRGFRVNETLRRKFTCVAAYFFVRQDSRTSVALCTACPPNRMSISLRFSSFQLIVHAELCLAYPHHYNPTTGVCPHEPAQRGAFTWRGRRAVKRGLQCNCHGAAWGSSGSVNSTRRPALQSCFIFSLVRIGRPRNSSIFLFMRPAEPPLKRRAYA